MGVYQDSKEDKPYIVYKKQQHIKYVADCDSVSYMEKILCRISQLLDGEIFENFSAVINDDGYVSIRLKIKDNH